jgi:hypothetical protein
LREFFSIRGGNSFKNRFFEQFPQAGKSNVSNKFLFDS